MNEQSKECWFLSEKNSDTHLLYSTEQAVGDKIRELILNGYGTDEITVIRGYVQKLTIHIEFTD